MSDGEEAREPQPRALERPAPMTHVAVRTRDIAASVDFYRRYAGFEIVHERSDGGTRVAWLSDRIEDPSFVIVILEMPHEAMPQPSATDHFGFAVPAREDIDRIAELALREGTLKLGPLHAGPIVGYIVMVWDPSGNTCEFSFGQPIHPRELQG